MSEVYTVPGVYVTETNGMSLSIQSGETAVPVFVGFFNAKTSSPSAALTCVRIDSWLDFTRQFGPSDRIRVDMEGLETSLSKISANGQKERNEKEKQAVIEHVHATPYAGSHCVRLYFENGGGPCYVLNLAREKVDDTYLAHIVPAIALCPDITLLCWCEFIDLNMDQKIYTVLGGLLAASPTLGGNPGRFLLTDAWPVGDPAQAPTSWTFEHPQVGEVAQAASYFPALLTGYAREYSDYWDESKALRQSWVHCALSAAQLSALGIKSPKPGELVTFEPLMNKKTALEAKGGANKTLAHVIGLVETHLSAALPVLQAKADPVLLRASVAMAGVYARVDRERGVWKAPANVGLAGVTALMAHGVTAQQVKWGAPVPVRLDEHSNEKLVENRINAIRAFHGQGLLVWGARTLNPPEKTDWRYVSVRRLFNTIERDARAALRTVVFEPNSPVVWEQVRGALDNYLNALWRKGALQGDTPSQAYYVHIGLGTTMSKQDIDKGRMIVKIGVAAVRPAEFIVLNLTQDVIAG